MEMINCLDNLEREYEIKAIEAYVKQECVDAIGRSVAKYGPKDGLIMAATEIPLNVVLLNGRLERLRNVHLNDAYTESFKAYREYVTKIFSSSQTDES